MNRYLLSLALLCGLIVGGVGALNYLVDPLLLYHHRDGGTPQLSALEQFPNMRLYKPYHVARVAPQALIVGSSRTGTLRPRFPDGAGVAYNLALPGMTLYEMNRSVRHAQAIRPLTRLLIGLDYEQLVSTEPRYRTGFEPARMRGDASGLGVAPYLAQRVQDVQASLFSLDMLGQSLVKLAGAGPGIRRYFPDGSWEELSQQLIGRAGYIFVAGNKLELAQHQRFDAAHNLAILRDLLDFCYRHSIDTRLFFTPSHAFVTDLWLRIGSKELWRSTYKSVVEMNAELAAQYRRPPFEIIGFDNEAAVVAEPIRPAREAGKAWISDGVHYRGRLARRVMAALWNPQRDFGQPVTPEVVDEYLDSVDAVREAFMASHREQVDALHRRAGLQPGQEFPLQRRN